MNDFDQTLDDCIASMSSGASTLDECLARHPEHAAQLRPLLQAASRLAQGRMVQPSPAFKARARAQLTLHMQAHPRRKTWVFPLMRLASGVVALFAVFLASGTALAQSALPNDPLYGWKLASESAWRAVSPDPLAADLALSTRRADEMLSVSNDSVAYAVARDGYEEVLARLTVQAEAGSQARILPILNAQRESFAQAGISIPELDIYLGGSKSPDATPAPTDLPSLGPAVVPSIVPSGVPGAIPTMLPTLPVRVPPLPRPTLPIPKLP